VLHPPRAPLSGPENVRSMVLHVRHAGRSILLTGDLEGEGLADVLSRPGPKAQVLLAPHHGSHRVDGPALVKWCGAGLVVSCQGPPQGLGKAARLYNATGAEFWMTHEQGAVTVRLNAQGIEARAFRTGRTYKRRE